MSTMATSATANGTIVIALSFASQSRMRREGSAKPEQMPRDERVQKMR
jgi:hypothetical protein